MRRYGASHAEAAVGIDIGGADETLHQLVGDIIVFGQQLARDIKSNAFGAVFGDCRFEPIRDMRQRAAPISALTVHLWIEQSPFQSDRFSKMRTL